MLRTRGRIFVEFVKRRRSRTIARIPADTELARLAIQPGHWWTRRFRVLPEISATDEAAVDVRFSGGLGLVGRKGVQSVRVS